MYSNVTIATTVIYTWTLQGGWTSSVLTTEAEEAEADKAEAEEEEAEGEKKRKRKW